MPSSNQADSPASEPAVIVEDVRKSFGDVHALQGISFTAAKANVLGILGPNGAGKTTTVKILSTLLRRIPETRSSRATTCARIPPACAARS